MRLPTSQELLLIWESHWDRPLLERILELLVYAYSLSGKEDAARLSIGERNSRLLQLREWMFGTSLPNTATCEHCGTKVEWENQSTDFRLQAPTPSPETGIHQLEMDGYHIQFRLPNSVDVIRHSESGSAAAEGILKDCLLESTQNGEPSKPEDLPGIVTEAVMARMEELDPQASISLELNCPACSNSWITYFEIMSYFWAEFDQWARETLQDVYLLARGFGWTESEILKLSPRRRQIYINMLSG